MRGFMWRRGAAAMALTACSASALACTNARTLSADTLKTQIGLLSQGQISQAWACTDKAGEHWVVASKLPLGDHEHKVQLLFAQFTRTASGWKKNWQARDFLPAQTKAASAEMIVIKDTDGDGLAEVFLAYALTGQAAAQGEGKLLVYYKDKKYAIRGAIAQTANDFGSRKIEPDFLTLPQPVQHQALQLWDKLSAPASASKTATSNPVFLPTTSR